MLTHVSHDALASIVEIALAQALAERPSAPALLRVRLLGDDVEVGWAPLEPGTHPLDALVGTRAPADWVAIGVVATGRMRHLDEPSAPALPVVTAHLVSRDGAWASWWQANGDGPPAEDEWVAEPGPVRAGPPDDPSRPQGRVDDACRRALGLPTAPPDSGTGVLWSTQWLDRVVAVAGTPEGRRRLARWPAVAALHPAVAALADPGTLPDPEGLADLARRLSSSSDWEELRVAAAASTWVAPGVPPDVADWLDAGAFSRWVLGEFPDLPDLHAAVASLLPTPVVEAVESVLDAARGSDGREARS